VVTTPKLFQNYFKISLFHI